MSIAKKLRHYIADIVVGKFPSLKEFIGSISLSRCRIFSLGDFQCNDSMRWAKILDLNPKYLAEELIPLFLSIPAISNVVISGPGFINFSLNKDWVVAASSDCLLPDLSWSEKRVVIDYSSPNIAKEMHVGHLRSTILGESLAKIITFLGGTVIRINHLGDWGTQFGMIIAYLQEKNMFSDDITLEEVLKIYQQAKLRFDNCDLFKEISKRSVVALQSGDADARKIWKKLCALSQESYDKIYSLLGVSIFARGESFYQSMLKPMVDSLIENEWAVMSDGACCMFIDGYDLPYMLQKSDGGFNYDTTDLAALRHRIEEERADVLVYVTDAGQSLHFQLLEAVGRKVGYLPDHVRFCHVPFGLVLRPDGKKFQTRSGPVEPLTALLYKAIESTKTLLESKNWSPDHPLFDKVANTVGIGAVKFLDLVNHRISDYKFSYEKMLQLEGKTAPFLMYARVRALSILRKLGKINEENGLESLDQIEIGAEWELMLCLLRFADIVEESALEMTPHFLAQYGYDLAKTFNSFFRDCRVEGDPRQKDRIIFCQITVRILTIVLDLLGIDCVDFM